MSAADTEGVCGSDVPARPTSPADLQAFKRALLAYADNEYCRSLQMFSTDPCLGWEARVKAGRYGETEHEAHRKANEHMGAHRGIYAAVKLAEAMLAASPPLPQEQGAVPQWMPIETAPKDGFVLLATEFDRPGDWRIKMGYRDTGPDSFHGWRVFGASWKPTHWMPLPAPPVADPRQAQMGETK